MKRTIIRLLALALCCTMVLAVVACNKDSSTADSANTSSGTNTQGNGGNSSSGNTDNAQSGQSSTQTSARDTLTVATGGDNGTLLPSTIYGGFAGVIRSYMGVLVDFEADGTPVWDLATGIDFISDELWRVHCREGVTFHNGSKFDAHDVWFTWERYKNDASTDFFLSCFDMDNSRIVDDYTIDFAIVNYTVLQLGSLSQVYIYDAETFNEDDFVMHPVGTGPYYVDEYVINSHLHMKAFENFWGGKAPIENLNYKMFNEQAQVINAIQSGAVDVSSIPAQDVKFVETLSSFDVQKYYSVFAATMAFNLNPNSVMSDLDARTAVCHAANRQAMCDLVYFGSATVLDYPLSSHSRDYFPELANMHPTYSIGYNLDVAKEHAEKAGLVGKDVVVVTNGTQSYITQAEILQEGLREIGVNLIINNYDGASFSDVLRDITMWDIIMYGAASPQQMVVGLLYEYVLWYPARWEAGWPEYNDYLALGLKAVGTSDEMERRPMLIEMSRMFVDTIPWFGVADQMAAVAINKDLGGVKIYGSGGMRYNEWYWKK